MAVIVVITAVSWEVITGITNEVRAFKGRFVLVEGGRIARRPRQLDGDGPALSARRVVALLVENAHVVAGHGLGGRARLDRKRFDAERVRHDRPARLGLPPVIDDRNAQALLRPVQRLGIATLAREVESAQRARGIPFLDLRSGRVLAADGAEGG